MKKCSDCSRCVRFNPYTKECSMQLTVGNSYFVDNDRDMCQYFLAQSGKCRVGDWRFERN